MNKHKRKITLKVVYHILEHILEIKTN